MSEAGVASYAEVEKDDVEGLILVYCQCRFPIILSVSLSNLQERERMI